MRGGEIAKAVQSRGDPLVPQWHYWVREKKLPYPEVTPVASAKKTCVHSR